ncbi:hypothetical protein AMJ57_04690 [Parcubacteria bacterium SG8_24]|nr:MAG: hypothetical protein AMJ57_04690 [Parcubacteria bacterium SG8_24]
MVRPRKKRTVRFDPASRYFKPRAIPLSELMEVILGRDELEALRLCDHEGLEQTAAARRMGISQSTLHRILRAARRKVADALSHGKAIRIMRAGKTE